MSASLTEGKFCTAPELNKISGSDVADVSTSVTRGLRETLIFCRHYPRHLFTFACMAQFCQANYSTSNSLRSMSISRSA